MQRLKSQATHLIRHRWTLSPAPVTAGRSQPWKPLLVKPDCASSYSHISRMIKDESQAQGKEMRKDVSKVEDDSNPLTYNIPEKPVTFVEGASYSFIILAGLGVAAFAAYAVLKELVFEPKEYTIFGEALKRVQNDSQVAARIGRPITGYGSESRNRAARQRIYNRVWRDAEGAEHVEVRFYIRGPHGTGQVRAEMLKNDGDRVWQFVDLTVVITSPSHAQFILESYIPTYQSGPGSLSMSK